MYSIRFAWKQNILCVRRLLLTAVAQATVGSVWKSEAAMVRWAFLAPELRKEQECILEAEQIIPFLHMKKLFN